MEYKGLRLDKFQEDAIRAIDSNHSVVVSAPTGSGKTLIADYIIGRDLKRGIRVIYTAPIKALSNQKYREFSNDYGEENIGLMTGDIVRNPNAPILIMTTEVYRNMVLSRDPMIEEVSYVVLDEIHYINDFERGYVWEESIIFSPPNIRFLCLSATIPNAEQFAAWIEAIKGHKVEVIKHTVRPVPLRRGFYDFQLGVCTLEEVRDIVEAPDYHRIMRGHGKQKKRNLVQKPDHVQVIKDLKDKIPCLFFVFSRSLCQKMALELTEANVFKANPQISEYVAKKLAQAPPEVSQLETTQILRRTLPYGIGFHHAGELPVIKELVEELFAKGWINVLYVTETFAVGINMPAKMVCFESMRKYDGIQFRYLTSKEYFQIAGRAGRRGIDKEGYAYVLIDRRDFDYKKFKEITDEDKDPIVSQFRLSVNTVLNLIKNHNEEEIQEILCKSFSSYQQYGERFRLMRNYRSHNAFDRIRKKLERMGYIYEGGLTDKGEFASKIYSDEIITSEIFGTNFYKRLNLYQVLLILGCLAYEGSDKIEFKNLFKNKSASNLKHRISESGWMKKEKRFRAIDEVNALLYPCYNKKDIFFIIDNTSMPEGDLIRFFRQIIDRIRQIRKASQNQEVINLMDDCQALVQDCIREVDII
ncbi:MAG: DEAD/DEAH box helicase [Candidatus Woesearchaeota archaeon]